MIRASDNDAFDSAQAKQQHERMREQIRNMEREQEQFMLGLNDYQKIRFQEHARNIQQHRERLENRLQLMEQEMNQADFSRPRHRTRMREMEKAIKKWREQFRDMEKHMAGS